MIRSGECAENGKPRWVLHADGTLEVNGGPWPCKIGKLDAAYDVAFIPGAALDLASIAPAVVSTSVLKSSPFEPEIVWRRGVDELPERAPLPVDVQDGRAEYLLSGPYHLAEGARIEVVDGKVRWTSGKVVPR